MKKNILIFLFFLFITDLYSQNITGQVIDKKSKETLIGANVKIIDGVGTTTDIDGNFTLTNITNLPIKIECSYIGYQKQTIEVVNYEYIYIKLGPDQEQLKEVQVRDTRLTERLRQSPVTIESLDINAIKETPASTFYEGLSNLKGVD